MNADAELTVIRLSRSVDPKQSVHLSAAQHCVIQSRVGATDVRRRNGDLADAAQVESAVDSVLESWSSIDILINNAGIAGDDAPVAELEESELGRVLVPTSGAPSCAHEPSFQRWCDTNAVPSCRWAPHRAKRGTPTWRLLSLQGQHHLLHQGARQGG